MGTIIEFLLQGGWEGYEQIQVMPLQEWPESHFYLAGISCYYLVCLGSTISLY